MMECGMNTSRSSSVRAAGLPSPIPVSGALLRTLALWPVGRIHYAKLPKYERAHNKAAVGSPTTGFLATRLRHMRTKLQHAAAKPKTAATLAGSLLLNRLSAAHRRTTFNAGTPSQTVSERRAA
jgi:hypothetical protein